LLGFTHLFRPPAALGLAKHGFAVTLLEQSHVVGGRVRSCQVRQKPYDLGATWLHGRSTEQNPLLRLGVAREFGVRNGGLLSFMSAFRTQISFCLGASVILTQNQMEIRDPVFNLMGCL
jgi:hypothetical protein